MNTHEHPPLNAQSLVAEVLAVGLAVALLFLDWRTECVGCVLIRFCTLDDVSRYYGLDLETLLTQIRARITSAANPKPAPSRI